MNATLKILGLPVLAAVTLMLAGAAMAGTWIIELDAPPAARWAAEQRQAGFEVDEDQLQVYRNELALAQDAFLDQLAAQAIDASLLSVNVPDFDGIEHSIDYRYTLVFNGVALKMDEQSVAQVRQLDGVRAVHRNQVYFPMLDESVDYIRAPEVYGEFAELTPFDDFREGFEGQGIIISVIDTGIEWSHEMFGADVSPPRFGLAPPNAALSTNEKVIYYLALHENVIDDFGHGTHAAGITSGFLGFGREGGVLDPEVPVHGVAPQSRLMGYKVCSGVGSAAGVFGCLGTSIILAIEDSVSSRTLTGFPKPVAHVINMSLGGAGGPDSATAIAADNAALLGTIVVSSAGNSGPGEGTVGAPAAGRHVIAVGANNDPSPGPNPIDVLEDPIAGDPGEIRIIADFAGDSNAGMAMIAPVIGRYVDAGLADTPDQVPLTVAGNICLAERGSSAQVEGQGTGLFALKVANCEAKGAIATVVFNNEPGRPGAILAPGTRPVFAISREDGLLLRDDLGFRADGLSNFPIELGLPDPSLFAPDMAGFSSRGPVLGFGQVKPDVTAPGVFVLSATSPIGVPVLSMQSETRYTRASGTSFSGPHVAGAVALVKQAHLGWTPDLVRTALINTATNLRDFDGAAKPDGPAADNILSQGGGLIDVFAAVNTPALMGVIGDGIDAPGLLGSHSFGEVPVIDSRVVHTESVEVSLVDVAGEGGTWDLSVVNNRDLQLDGIEAELSAASVPAGGSFTVNATVDGDQIRDAFAAKVFGNTIVFEPIQMQFYVMAKRGDDTLRMPIYLKPTPSVPADVESVQTEIFEDVMPAGDTNLQLVEDVTFKDFPVEVDAATFRLRGDLSFDDLAGGLPDLDLFLLDPDGDVVASSTNAGGPEHITHRPARTGTFAWRVTGWVNTPTEFQLDSVRELGGEPPVLAAFEGDFIDSQGRPVDFDGELTLAWQPQGNPLRFEVERSVNGGPFELIAELDGSATELELSDQPDGELAFRMRALFSGQIGFFVSAPSAAETVVVSRREQVEITESVKSAISNVSFTDNVFALDLSLTNQSGEDFVPLVEFNIIGINSASGTVHAINTDNGGSGTSLEDPALFDYSHELGGDDVFNAGETTGARRLEFQNNAAELFTFDAVVTAYTAATGESGAGDGDSGGTDGSSAGTDDGDGSGDLAAATSLLRFTVHPLLGTVTVELLGGTLL